MKKKIILMFAFFTVVTFGVQTAAAQITINVPKIPKIKKDKPQPTPTPNNTNQSNENPSNDNQNTENATKKSEQDSQEELGPVLKMWFGELQEAVKEAEEYTPQSDRAIYTYSGKHDWGLIAVSASARKEWYKGYLPEEQKANANAKSKFDAAFDKLAGLLAKHMPAFKGSLASYTFRNPADERVLKTVFEDITRYQIYSYGIKQNTWLLEKNDYGIPVARYKHAVFYLRDKKGDNPYCYLTFVNIIQDYSGGGTYAASRARFIEDQLVGCPAGAK